MHNYEHEIACPDNKGIRNYLWYDHFHDSKINDIVFNLHKNQVVIVLECSRDIEAKRKKIKGDRKERDTYINHHIEEFIYTLTFKGTEYFNEEKFILSECYINGRFKDTAILRKFEKRTNKLLYHFRIQTIGGYIDVVFSDFIIRKNKGRVKYYNTEISDYKCNSTLQDIKIALNGDDFDRFLAMKRLNRMKNASLLEIARKNLKLEVDWEDSCIYSAYLLGKYGDISDVPLLFDLYVDIEDHMENKANLGGNTSLIKRDILDAIELIKFRSLK